MSRKQKLGNCGTENNSSLCDINKHVKNFEHYEHVDYEPPSETRHTNEGVLQNFSKFSCASSSINLPYSTKLTEMRAAPPTRSFPYPRKCPKVYATRDFPEHGSALVPQSNYKRSEGFTDVVMDEHSDGENFVADMPAKTLVSKPVNSLSSYSKNHDMNEIPPPSITWKAEKGKGPLTIMLKKHKHHAFVNSIDGCSHAEVGSNEAPNYNVDANELANLSVVRHDAALAAKNAVKETMNLFRELYNELSDEHRAERKKEGTRRRFDVEAAERLKKKGKWIHLVQHFGHIPGIAVGDQFHLRAELAVVGLHRHYISGIDYVVLDGKKFATSIVDSGRYENTAKSVDVLIYSGQGGHVEWGSKEDQKLERGNLAMVNSMKNGHPVRVIKKTNLKSRKSLVVNDKLGLVYTYDGLYVVNKCWQERDHQYGKLVFKFELHRMSSQHKLPHGKSRTSRECCLVDDVSQGKENVTIRVMNGIDGEKPQTFAYTTNMTYPERHRQIQGRGCNCTNGCSNSRHCLCILKNGGEIPFSEKGAILRRNDIVYECGPSCKCPPSCMNRVSQHGLRYRLEVYKTESGRWGVRSPSYISAGSFVCEYVGKLHQIKDTKDDQVKFTIDATKLGNVARFISYSSSPNISVQRVLYDHGDDRVPHIMLFAAKNIPPLRELSCDYNNKRMDQICRFEYQLQQQ